MRAPTLEELRKKTQEMHVFSSWKDQANLNAQISHMGSQGARMFAFRL